MRLDARRAGATLLAAALVLSIAATTAYAQESSPSPAPKVTFTVGVVSDLNSANPFRQLDTYEAFTGGLMYDGLLRLAQTDYQPEPELADRWDVSDDGLTWTFRLRDGLTWSDGVPITAQDFVWTAEFIIANDISSWSDGYTYTESVTAVDDRTIVWRTTRPTVVPGLPGYNMILPEHVWGDFTVKELKSFRNFPDPVVSGSFNLVEWRQGEYWRMEARDDYWAGAPNIDEIVFRIYNSSEAVVQALVKGAIDYTTIPTAPLFEAVKDRPGIGTAIDSAEGFYQMSFNVVDDPKSTAHPAVLDPVVRSAVEYAIDRETLIERVLRGYATPGSTPIVPFYDYWHWEPPPDVARRFDPAEANRILDEAGYLDTDGDGVREMPAGGEPLQFRLYVDVTDSDGIKAAPFIQSWMGDIGIEVSIRSMTDSKLFDLWLEAFDWDMIIFSWGTTPDPDFLLSSFTTNQCAVWSDTCYSNPEYDALYKEQQTTIDPIARRGLVHQMQQIIYRDSPEIVLWYPNSFEAWRSDRWTGFVRWPEPDGVAFFGNYYSARLVRPLAGGAVPPGGAESGPSGVVWLAGLAIIAAAIAGSAARRRRLDEYYA
jgi:peptide/nickel transport system substrate-binding protein